MKNTIKASSNSKNDSETARQNGTQLTWYIDLTFPSGRPHDITGYTFIETSARCAHVSYDQRPVVIDTVV